MLTSEALKVKTLQCFTKQTNISHTTFKLKGRRERLGCFNITVTFEPLSCFVDC